MIHYPDALVNTQHAPTHTYTPHLSAQFVMRKRYVRAGVNHPDGRPKILLGGDPVTGIGRNVRTSDGALYTGATLNIRCDILDEAQADGLHTIEIVITYRKTGNSKTFSAPIATIRDYAEKVYMDGCEQWALAKHFWLCDGQPQTQPKPTPKPQSEAQQAMLFAEPRRIGGY